MKFRIGAHNRHSSAAFAGSASLLDDTPIQWIPMNIPLINPLKTKLPHRAQRDFCRTLLKKGEIAISSEKHTKQAVITRSVYLRCPSSRGDISQSSRQIVHPFQFGP